MQVSNRAFKHTAVDVSERNVLALMHELYTGRIAEDADLRGGCIHRSRPARGPTTAEVRLLTQLQKCACGSVDPGDDGGPQTFL